jgi:IS4 transposase
MHRNTRFGELLKVLPRGLFEDLVNERGTDKWTKGFTSYRHLISMIYAQLSQSEGLRELSTSFNAHSSAHYHLGTGQIKRSTLSDANREREAGLFGAYCHGLMAQVTGRYGKELKACLQVIDSSPILLRGRGYEWTAGRSQYRIPGLKLHLVLAKELGLPRDFRISDSKESDLSFGYEVKPQRGVTYVFDKAYTDYGWWWELDQAGSHYVTRFKVNASLKVDRELEIPQVAQGVVLSDSLVKLSYGYVGRKGKKRKNPYRKSLRRIVIDRPDKETPLVIATNIVDRPALEVAQLYRDRWAIELWFKRLKQRLKIKRFVGCSENAVKIQVYVALITYLLVYLYRRLGRSRQSFYLWMAEFRSTLFQPVDRGDRRHPPPDSDPSLSPGVQVEIPL